MADAEQPIAEPWFETTFARCYTHGGDMDGFLCGELAASLGLVASRDHVQPLDYGSLGSIAPSEEPILVCDLNLPDHHAAWFSPNVVIIDHHRLPPDGHLAVCLHRENACAAAIMWETTRLLHKRVRDQTPPLAMLVDAINAGDLFLTQEEAAYRTSRRYTYLLRGLGWPVLWELFSTQRTSMLALPPVLSDILDGLIDGANTRGLAKAAETLREVSIRGDDLYLGILGEGDPSVIGNQLSEQRAHPVGLVVLNTLDADGIVQVAVRDNGNRAAEIATKCGGGGHPAAAGFSAPIRTLMEMWEEAK